MRTYGRIPNSDGTYAWVEVDPDDDGGLSNIYLTTLCQVLKLNLNESPFYATWGIPAQSSIIQQVAPDFYATQTQAFFAPYFASIIISRISSNPPTYQVNVITKSGDKLNTTVAR